MSIKVNCKNLSGDITVPYSKSLSHRYMLAAFLSGKIDLIESFDAYCEDLAVTKECLLKLSNNEREIDCKESGTTFRFLMAVLPALGINAKIHISNSLAKRPITELIDCLNQHGAEIAKLDENDYQIAGKLQPGVYEIPGNITSQYISALLFAQFAMNSEIEIKVNGEIESKPYVDLTIQTLKGEPSPLEGDWSLGAMWLAISKILGGSINVVGLNEDSEQADAVFQDLLDIDDDLDVIVSVQDCPDLAPSIALWAIGRDADTTITDAGRLKLKESDRLNAIVSVLTDLGAKIKSQDDRIEIVGNNHKILPGSDKAINAFNDHRIVMLAALCSAITEKPVTIDSPESVSKSYPNFFKEIEKLGGKIEWN